MFQALRRADQVTHHEDLEQYTKSIHDKTYIFFLIYIYIYIYIYISKLFEIIDKKCYLQHYQELYNTKAQVEYIKPRIYKKYSPLVEKKCQLKHYHNLRLTNTNNNLKTTKIVIAKRI